MADIKATTTETQSYQEKQSLLQCERRRLRQMKIVFALYCAILILSALIALALKP